MQPPGGRRRRGPTARRGRRNASIAPLTLAAALTVIPGVKQIGVSLFASAGIAGIAIGLAARPVLSNLIAGLQIAFTQPIRLDDAVVVEDEWGWIEEIGLFWEVLNFHVCVLYFDAGSYTD